MFQERAPVLPYGCFYGVVGVVVSGFCNGPYGTLLSLLCPFHHDLRFPICRVLIGYFPHRLLGPYAGVAPTRPCPFYRIFETGVLPSVSVRVLSGHYGDASVVFL